MDKICGICGEDCSDRPRVKDRKGRYFCKSCAMSRAAEQQRAVPAAAALEPVPIGAEADGDPFQIDPGASPFPVEMLRGAQPAGSCPVCMHSLAPGSRICVSCGYDVQKGVQTSTLVEKTNRKGKRGHFCRECGYDLKGLRDPVCPECGTRVKANKRADWDKETERQTIRAEWTKPAMTLGIGLLALAGLLAARDSLEFLAFYPLFLGAQVAVGFVILWISFTFLGDLGTPLLNLLRLTAIYVVVDFCSELISGVPLGMFGWALPAFVYVGLFINFFDVHWEDAWIVLLINWVVKMAIVITAVLYFAQ